MKKLSFIFSFLLVATMAMAQQNLREGYVITLEGDTLHGMIDFRTSAMNAKRCVFKENGATEFKTYLPGEIDSYRFLHNGIYYVSKNVLKEDNTREMVFAEYVIRGNMNLYQIGSYEMLLVDEDGNEASFSVTKARSAKSPDALREEMGDVWKMLSKSEKAGNMIWALNKSRDNTKKTVMTYIDDVCTDGYCEVFEYRAKNTPEEDRAVHPWVKVGYKATQYKFYNDKTVTGYAPQVSAGADIHWDRLFKGLMVNVGIAYESAKATSDKEKYLRVKFNQLDLMLGPGYQFQVGALKTRVKCGAIYRAFSRDFAYPWGNYPGLDFKFDEQFGLYAGAGLEIPLKKFSLICDLDYIYDYNIHRKHYYPEKTKVLQNGICLSAGVKF